MTHVQPADSIDYLTRLPAELFQHILELVEQPWNRRIYLGLVSKAFLPFARSRIFAKITINGSAELRKLAETIETSRGAGAHVKELSLSCASVYYTDDGTLSSKAVITLLARLPKLEHLRIKGSTRLSKLVLTDNRTPRLFSNLLSLTIDDPLEGWSQPFDPSHYSHLARYPTLHGLDLIIPRSSGSFTRYRPPKEMKRIGSKWRWGLTLKGVLLGNAALGDLLQAFTAIGQLFLHEHEAEHVDTLPDFLVNIPHPWNLYALSLDLPRAPKSFDALANALRSFHSLELLQFLNNAFDPVLLSTIRSLPKLEKIYLHGRSNVSSAEIKNLLTNSFELIHLRILSLAVLDAADWDDAPMWTSNFTQTDMEEIIELAEAKNVEVKGYMGDWVRRAKREREKEQARGRKKAIADVGGVVGA